MKQIIDFESSSVLTDMFECNQTLNSNGEKIPLSSVVIPENLNRLHNLVREVKPKQILEIGMAQGASSLAILSAIEANGSGRLVSVDPFQNTDWEGAGLVAVDRAVYSEKHHFIEEPDYICLPEMVRREKSFDFAYIDGYHSFDYTLVDFFYIDLLLVEGGIVGFNDVGMKSVEKVIRFVKSHKKYEEVLPYKIKWTKRKKMRFWEWPDRYFRKIKSSQVHWEFYEDF